MKITRLFTAIAGLCLSVSVMAQKALTEDGVKAQKALIEHLRINSMVPTVDPRDNSVNFKSNGVLYWVTFEESAPVLYTIHRKGLKFDDDANFKPSCARVAVNEVNRSSKAKATYHDKRVEFYMQSYAKEPSDFHGGLRKMLAAFNDIDVKYKNYYSKALSQWNAENKPITPQAPVGASPLKVTYIAFGNFDAKGNVISDYNQPLRKSAIKYIKASLDVQSEEKGIYKLGMKIFTPEGKAMVATAGMNYSTTTNIEIKKTNKVVQCDLDPYGSDEADFWKAGEYKVEIYDFEKGAMLFSTTFNVL